MKAMIFAAGMGTRLRPLTDHCPKALIPVAGTPMLAHVIGKLKAAGYDSLVVNVHHLATQIIEFLHDNHNFGMQISLSDETSLLLDTGGGLQKASPLLLKDQREDEGILVHNVDILSDCDLRALAGYHHAQCPQADATLLVSRRQTSRYLLTDANHRLRGWINKQTGQTKPEGLAYVEGEYEEYAYSGIQVVSPHLLRHMPAGKYSIIDYYLSACDRLRIQCYPADDLHLIDIGKPETLERAKDFLTPQGT